MFDVPDDAPMSGLCWGSTVGHGDIITQRVTGCKKP